MQLRHQRLVELTLDILAEAVLLRHAQSHMQ